MLRRLLNFSKHQLKKGLVRYLVWDFDGTLYDDPSLGAKLKDEYITYINDCRHKKISATEFDQLNHKFGRWSKLTASLLNQPEIETINQVEQRFDKSRHLKRNKGLVKKIEDLQQYRHLILTNSPLVTVKKCLTKIGFQEKEGLSFYPFETIIDLNQTGVLKPKPQSFQAVMRYTQIKPINHLMIGDSYRADVEPARKIGFQATLIKNLGNYIKINI